MTVSFKHAFSRALGAVPGRLHVAAHSHHPWPDVTFEAQQRAWDDAAEHLDDKWDVVFGGVLTEARTHIARRLSLTDPATIAVGPNTHGFLVRLLSCLPRPTRILTTDGEFHSLTRQLARLEEAGAAAVERVPVEPFGSFPDRFASRAAAGGHDLVFLSHVMFNSGYVVPDVASIVAAVPDDATFVVIDGYHGFMALPSDLAALEQRAFYVAGGYKYAMAGEGACFLHCPPGYAPRPPDTGWFAGFGLLEDAQPGRVPYAEDGSRFLGATFDPTGFYRFNAAQRMIDDLGLVVAAIHHHVLGLEARFLDVLARLGSEDLSRATLLPPEAEAEDRGHFLTFRTPRAEQLHHRLHSVGVITDRRADRLRFGFGLYHDDDDVDELGARLAAALATSR